MQSEKVQRIAKQNLEKGERWHKKLGVKEIVFARALPFRWKKHSHRNGSFSDFQRCCLFCIGVYEAKTTVGSLWRSGLQMAAIGLTAGLVGFLIGHFIGALPL